MRRETRWIRGCIVAVLLAACAAHWTSEARAAGDSRFAIVVASEWSNVQTLDARVLRKIFLGKVTSYAGAKVEPVHQAVGSPIRWGFNKAVLRKTEANLSNYWIQQALSGGAQPPHAVDSHEEVVARVAEEVGVIGYVDTERLKREKPAGIRAIGVIVKGREISPFDPDSSLTY